MQLGFIMTLKQLSKSYVVKYQGLVKFVLLYHCMLTECSAFFGHQSYKKLSSILKTLLVLTFSQLLTQFLNLVCAFALLELRVFSYELGSFHIHVSTHFWSSYIRSQLASSSMIRESLKFIILKNQFHIPPFSSLSLIFGAVPSWWPCNELPEQTGVDSHCVYMLIC